MTSHCNVPQVSRIHSNLSKSYFHWKVRFLFGMTVGGLVGLVCYISKKVRHEGVQ